MADHIFSVQPVEEVACYNSDAPKTVLQIQAPSNVRVKIRGWSIAFDGVSITAEPIEVLLRRQTTAGAMTSLTPLSLAPRAETIQTSAQYSATVEPGTSDVFDSIEVHPQSGYEVKYPEDECPLISPSEYIGIVVTAKAAVNCRVKMICEE